MRRIGGLAVAVGAVCSSVCGAGAQDWSPASLAAEAERVAEVCTAQATRDWLSRAGQLPDIEPITLHVGPRADGGFDRVVLTDAAFDRLPETEREGLTSVTFGTERYYATFYGTPLAYAPAIEAIADAGLGSFDGLRVLDFGYGQLGQIEMLARCGAEVHGVEVDPVVHKLYEEGNASREVVSEDGPAGALHLHLGRWFSDDEFRASVGGDFDVFLARNVLKKGYVTPEQPMQGFDAMDVGGSPERGAEIVFEPVAPGGIAIVYNLGGKHWIREDGSYNNPADIRDPFGREAWERAGFEVLAFEADGSAEMRETGVAVGWAETIEEVADYHVHYSVFRRPR